MMTRLNKPTRPDKAGHWRTAELKKTKMKFLLLSLLILLSAVPAHADVVWPALFLETRLFSIWPIVVGLIIEYLFLRQYFKLPIKRAVVADIVINAFSSALGIVLIPIAGVAWEFFPGIILYKALNIGTFNPGTWTVTYLMAAAINAGVESLALSKIFKSHVGKKGFRVLFLANAISVGIAMLSLYFYPMEDM